MAKRNYKGRIIGLLIVGFITTNAFLIFFDDEDQVDRKSYVNEWSKTITYDLFQKMNTKGVFTSDASTPVYFNEDLGSFRGFLVKEGDTVSSGDGLYTYEVSDYAQQEAQLQEEITRLEQEITAIEDYISEMESYQIPEPDQSSNNSNSIFGRSDETESSTDEEDPSSYIETEFLKEEKIAEQEAELSKKEAMLEIVEDQLEQLRENGDQITVTSTFSGTVTDISKDLKAPLLTIESTNLVIEGELQENERTSVEEGMSAEVYIPELDMETTGTLSSVKSFPENVDVNRSSRYPFTIGLDKTDETVLPGYHADVTIITDETLDAVTALETALETDENLIAWVMNQEGILERREVETGLEEDGLVAIASGLEEGEWLAISPKDEFRNGTTFFTPIHQEDLRVRELFNMDQTSILTYGLLGFLSR